jgi:hypothetical protein
MKRRTFLQSIVALPGLALIHRATAPKPPPSPDRPRYIDSLGNSPATLAALADNDPATGVTYQG